MKRVMVVFSQTSVGGERKGSGPFFVILFLFCVVFTSAASAICTVPESISLDSPTYSATVGSTFSVTVSGGCGSSIQDNTSGGYLIVPSTDTDLDCNGTTCMTGNTPSSWSRELKCEAAGTYNIRAYSSGTVYSAASTVTCNALHTKIRNAIIRNAVIR